MPFQRSHSWPMLGAPVPDEITMQHLQDYGQEACGLRQYLGAMDPSGELSGLLLLAALSRIDDLVELISGEGELRDGIVWDPLDAVPTSVRRAGSGYLPAWMLIMVADLAASFTRGYRQPDTQAGALAMEVILDDAVFKVELWDLDISTTAVLNLRDPLLIDIDHLMLHESDRKLSRPRFRSLFESYFAHPNGRNGLHPFVEPR